LRRFFDGIDQGFDMKQSFARQHSSHRNHTPSPIRLPPPRPPVTEKRPEASPKPAMMISEEPALPASDEAPAATSQTPLSRQARRKAIRAEAKALRRKGSHPATLPQPIRTPAPAADLSVAEVMQIAQSAPVAEIAPAPAVSQAAKPQASEPALAAEPMPRERALVTAKPRGLARFGAMFRALFYVKQVRAVPAGRGEIASQLRTLRAELAALQRSVDSMIDSVAA
jgi:hypothetical protein